MPGLILGFGNPMVQGVVEGVHHLLSQTVQGSAFGMYRSCQSSNTHAASKQLHSPCLSLVPPAGVTGVVILDAVVSLPFPKTLMVYNMNAVQSSVFKQLLHCVWVHLHVGTSHCEASTIKLLDGPNSLRKVAMPHSLGCDAFNMTQRADREF